MDWIEELKTNAPDSERAFLEEVLCFLKRFPISDEFQNALQWSDGLYDTDFPPTRGLLEEQVKVGMKDAWGCGKNVKDFVFGVVGGEYDDIGWLLITEVFQTGFYWIDTTINGYQNYYALLYYDNESEEAVFIHSTRSPHYEDDYFGTTLKYRLTSGIDASIYLPKWIEEQYDSLENDEDDRSITLYYLGRKCEVKENDSPLGLFNWKW